MRLSKMQSKDYEILQNTNGDTKSPFYLPVAEEVSVFEHAFHNKLPLLIKGPTGTGKSRFIEFMAHKLGKELITISCNEETSSVDIVGRYLIKGDETIWVDGPLTKAVRKGAFIYLDEIAESRPDVMVAIHSLTDHRRILYLDRHDEVIKAKNDFMLIASYNPGYQSGWKELKPSTRQRFIGQSFNYPSEDLEVNILLGESGIDKATAKKLVKIGHKIRNLTELGLLETVSTRLLVDAAKLIHTGLDARLACYAAISEPLTDEEDILNAINDLINLII